MKTALLIAVLGAFLVVSVLFAARAWVGVDTQMSGHGWVALVIGAVLSLLVGGGLMALVFFSSRRGWDDIDRDL